MLSKKKSQGRIIIPAGVTPWPHEMRVARILVAAGHTVEFLPERNSKTADILLDGTVYEIKSPRSDKSRRWEENVKYALKQSNKIIFDSSRIKDKQDENVYHFLISVSKRYKSIKKLIFITKRGKTIDIK